MRTKRNPRTYFRNPLSLPNQMSVICTLPDLCLLRIFSHLPFSDFLTIPLICSRWSSLYPTACHQRPTLNLLIGSEITTFPRLIHQSHFPVTLIETNQSHLKVSAEPTEDSTDFLLSLVDTFPNIVTLNLCIIDVNSSINHQLATFLAQLAPKLTQLQIWAKYLSVKTHSHDLSLLIDSINQLSALKVLSLEFWNVLVYINLPILGTVESFSFFSYDQAELIYQSLAQHASSNPNLKELKLRNQISTDYTFEKFAHLPLNVASKVTDLSFNYQMVDLEEQFRSFCYHFASLQYFAVKLSHLNLPQLAPYLTLLPKLEHLCLHIDFLTLEPATRLELATLPPLPSVRILSLRIWIYSHDNLQQLHLPKLFPNLKVIHFYNEAGCNCDEEIEDEQDCIRKLLNPLKECKQLTRICNTYEGYDVLTEELQKMKLS